MLRYHRGRIYIGMILSRVAAGVTAAVAHVAPSPYAISISRSVSRGHDTPERPWSRRKNLRFYARKP